MSGNSLVTPANMMNVCNNKVIAKPNAINLYFSLVKSKAAFMPRINNNKYANNKKVTPIKPNSSPIAAKIKSV